MTADELLEILKIRLDAPHVLVQDDSAKHRGHAGSQRGAGHFKAEIVSPLFKGLAPVERHRLVFQTIAQEMDREIHALSLKLYSPEEWLSSHEGRV
ncbi:MAG: BolA family transcriptional regulator [Candidatus Omnitrophica bacterium]|nr:BolA family transcriptional regulator [Candidatus Omnitrophota bacterium]